MLTVVDHDQEQPAHEPREERAITSVNRISRMLRSMNVVVSN